MGVRLLATAVGVCVALGLQGQAPPSFAGTWALNAPKSQNLGMMASMHDTLTITQSPTVLTIRDRAIYQGQESTRELRIDLTGKPMMNVGPMGDQNETIAKWAGGKLVVTWTAEGAVAGTKVVRTETRALSPDGRAMTVESVRGTNAPIVMVYDKR